MNHQSQVCSLELSQKLFTLGVKKNSLFVWDYLDEKTYSVRYYPYARGAGVGGLNGYYYSAFTVAELGEMLPGAITVNSIHFKLEFIKGKDNRWLLGYVESGKKPPLICVIDDSEANARAKMLIDLIENKLMEAPK